MYTAISAKEKLLSGAFDKTFSKLYSDSTTVIKAQSQRYCDAVDEFVNLFKTTDGISFFSAPGRTEVGGNHTDHQHGCVLAASVNLDVIAVVAKNNDNVIRIKSKGYNMDTIDINDLGVKKSEKNRAASLIRGVVARFKDLGYNIGGFDAYTTSNVLKGSGLSSSAAFEVLVGTILSYVFNDAKISAVEIAQIGQFAENVYFGKPSGLMDQMASSVGGFVAIDFNDPKNPIINKVEFDFASSNHALCIIDTGGNHADLTDEYGAVPSDMTGVAKHLGKDVLRDICEKDFYAKLGDIRKELSDRAALRAVHFFEDNKRAQLEAEALNNGDFDEFKRLVIESGNSSFMYNQNVYTCKNPTEQGLSLALAVSEKLLKGKGAWRVHGGGFAGTIQAFVPNDMLEEYKTTIEGIFGNGTCHILNIRPVGGTKVEE